MAVDLGQSHFLWAGTLIMFFQMKFKFSKKIQTVYDFTQNFCFLTGLLCLSSKSLYPESNQLQLQCSPYQKSKGLLKCL